MRYSYQRQRILDYVSDSHAHPSAAAVYDALRESMPRLSLGTVYRNLNLLSQMGQIRRLEIPGCADRFDHITYSHCHAQCRICRRIFDVDMEFVTGLEKGIKNTQGFEFSGYDILFYGTCPDCRMEQAEAHMK